MDLRYPREMLQQAFEQNGVDLDAADREHLFAVIDTVFFASLMVEESEAVRVAVVHHEDGAKGLAAVVDESEASEGENAWDVTEFAPQHFTAEALAKLSRGIEYGAQLVVVGGTNADSLRIDGTARRMPRTDGGNEVRIAAPRPGVLVFEQGEHERLRFEGGRRVHTVDVLGRNGPVRSAIGRITGSSFNGDDGYSPVEFALRTLLAKMRSTCAGAVLAMMNDQPDKNTLDSIKFRGTDTKRFRRRIDDAWDKRSKTLFLGIGDGKHVSTDEIHRRSAKRAEASAAELALDAAIHDLARLSAIDGAVLAGPGLEVYGAGYIIPGPNNRSPDTPELFRATDASLQTREHASALFGARHRAAYSFVAEGPGRVAFVVSEDGPVTCAVNDDNAVVTLRVQVLET